MLDTNFDRLRGVRNFDDLTNAIHDFRNKFDVEHVVYHSVKSSGEQYAALTYTDEWVKRYLEQDYARIDPVVTSCFRRFHPVDWKNLDWSKKTTRAFLREAVDAGVGQQGFSVPIRGPSGQFALFTISDRVSDERWAMFTENHMHEVILAAHYVNMKALELEKHGTDEADLPSLSPRETDALTCLALGLSRAQAADKLKISEHTLRVYIESARFKLSALNTTHAVARALSSGLLIV